MPRINTLPLEHAVDGNHLDARRTALDVLMDSLPAWPAGQNVNDGVILNHARKYDHFGHKVKGTTR